MSGLRSRARDGRLLAVAIVAVFFVSLVVVDSTTGSAHWTKFGVGAGPTNFLDTGALTSAWECVRRGVEAFPINQCDPLGRPFDYPRWVSRLTFLGLGEGDTEALGVLIASLFYVAALLVTGPLTLGEGLLYAVMLLSPPVLLGVERGNGDLLMFALVALGVGLVRRSAWLGGAPIAFAAAAKLYPALALAILFRKRSRFAAGAFWAALFVVYVALTLHDIRVELHQIPAPITNAFGAAVIPDALRANGVSWMQSAAAVREMRFGVILEAVALAVVLALFGRRRAPSADELRLDGFCAGAAVYVGSYAFESNFDYRLIFLLLCVPQLCAWRRNGTGPLALPGAALVAILATLWLSSAIPPLPFGLQTWYMGLTFPPEEALNWFLFAWLGAALALALAGRSYRPARGGISLQARSGT
jgi:Glycosyltransferase family 87